MRFERDRLLADHRSLDNHQEEFQLQRVGEIGVSIFKRFFFGE